jgi:hypothetical protein
VATRESASPKAQPGTKGVLETLRAGYRERNTAKIASAYAEDVESTIVNRNNPPSKPLVLRGREALMGVITDICSREMTHEITATVETQDALVYKVQCRYPDGCNVVGLYMATIRDGRVVKEFSIDCWDE